MCAGVGVISFFATGFCRWGSGGPGGVFLRAGKCERILERLWYEGNVSPFLGGFQAGGVARWNGLAWQCLVGARRHRGAFTAASHRRRPGAPAPTSFSFSFSSPCPLGGVAQISQAARLHSLGLAAKYRFCARVSACVCMFPMSVKPMTSSPFRSPSLASESPPPLRK